MPQITKGNHAPLKRTTIDERRARAMLYPDASRIEVTPRRNREQRAVPRATRRGVARS